MQTPHTAIINRVNAPERTPASNSECETGGRLCVLPVADGAVAFVPGSGVMIVGTTLEFVPATKLVVDTRKFELLLVVVEAKQKRH